MQASASQRNSLLDLRAGDIVEVRTVKEILATLDHHGTLDALPMMPEMLKFCGKQFQVAKRADKTCDTIEKTGLRRMTQTVHLEETRCDGKAHGGCQAGCLLFWKEAWLKRVANNLTPAETLADNGAPHTTNLTDVPTDTAAAVAVLHRTSRRETANASTEDTIFVCQATELRKATMPLAWWDLRHYVRDVRSGNAGLFTVIADAVRHLLIGTFNMVQHWRGGRIYPFERGMLKKTPTAVLDLQIGEQVQVKTKEEIFQTLDANNRNHGLSFDTEMVPYCSGTFTVLQRVQQIINERTGKMMQIPNDCLILKGVTCIGQDHKLCPRSIYPYWREIWLRRAP